MGKIGKSFGAEYINFGGNMFGPMSDEIAARYAEVPTYEEYASAIHEELTVIYQHVQI